MVLIIVTVKQLFYTSDIIIIIICPIRAKDRFIIKIPVKDHDHWSNSQGQPFTLFPFYKIREYVNLVIN